MTGTTKNKSKLEILQNFVAFSEYLNFNSGPRSSLKINNLKLFTTDIDFDMDFIDDMTANPTTNFTAALQNMVTFKLEAHNFDEMKVWANDYLKRVDESTDFGINNAYKLTMAYENTANTGKELVSEVHITIFYNNFE